MPALVAKYQEKVTVTKLKKAYSILSQAYAQAIAENGEFSAWFPNTTSSQANLEIFFNNIEPYLKFSKICGFTAGCLPPGDVKTIRGTNYNNYDNNTAEYKAILADGTSIVLHTPGLSACKADPEATCGNIKVLTNGLKGPYIWGKDFFQISIYPNKLAPAGTAESGTFLQNCLGSTSIGHTCAAWVIYNENMDYLHCNDLSWDGKTRCD